MVLECFLAIFSNDFSVELISWSNAGMENKIAILVALGITSFVD